MSALVRIRPVPGPRERFGCKRPGHLHAAEVEKPRDGMPAVPIEEGGFRLPVIDGRVLPAAPIKR